MNDPGLSGLKIEEAEFFDAGEILDLQKIAYLDEARLYCDYDIPPLVQTLEQIRADFQTHDYLKAVLDDRIIGSVRGIQIGDTCSIGRLIVHPEYQNRGIGTLLMSSIEAKFQAAERFELFTGHRSQKNLHLYGKLGYRVSRTEALSSKVTLVFMEKLTTERG